MYIITCVPVQWIYEIDSCVCMPIRCFEWLIFSKFFLDFTWVPPAVCFFAVLWTLCLTSPWPLLVFTVSSPFIACFHLKILFSPLFLNCCLCCANTAPSHFLSYCTTSYWLVQRLPPCSQFLDCFPPNDFFFYSENLVAANSSEIVNYISD